MSLINGSRILSRPILQLLPATRVVNVGWSNRSVATVPPGAKHPNPSNFANRSHEELSALGKKGGEKGGKARGKELHAAKMEKQDTAKRGRRRKVAAEHEETELKAEQHGRSTEPSVIPPGFEEWKTCV